MAQYEYKVVPAPRKGIKAKGHKTNEARFSNTLQDVMNSISAEGWEYLRAETLPSDERQGLTGSQTIYRDVLVFRRPRSQDEAAVNPVAIEHMPDNNPAEPTLEPHIPQDHADADDTRDRREPYLAPFGNYETEGQPDNTDESDTTEPPTRSG